MNRRRPVPVPKKPAGTVPEEDAAERAALGFILSSSSERDADALLDALPDRLIYHAGRLELLRAIRTLRMNHRAVDLYTVGAAVKDATWLPSIGGLAGLSELQDAITGTTMAAVVSVLDTAAALRESRQRAQDVLALIQERRAPDEIRKALRDIADTIQKPTAHERSPLVVTSPGKHLAYKPPEGLCLVGDYDITKGYEGVAVIGGPPGSGKSLAANSLALAGALGVGEWMGRPVHRKFRTLCIQAENGAMRLQNEFRKMKEEHPRANLDDAISVTLPPEGGLPFHKPEFRRAVTAHVREFRPDVVIVDPWTAVAADDAAKDVVDKLAEIRACLPPGDECPALVIVAHTRKPRAEGMKKGRGLLNELSGSLALGATARTVFILLPFTDEIEDDRVLWSCAKLSNGLPPGESVWHRRLGTFFQPAAADPAEFWAAANGETKRKSITDGLIQELMHGRALARKQLVQAIKDAGFKHSSAQNAVTDRLKNGLLEDKGGLLVWKDE